MSDIPPALAGDHRMDIYREPEGAPRSHTYVIYENLHHPKADAASVKQSLMQEPSLALEARIDGISDTAIRHIQVWLCSPDQHRKIRRQEIIEMLMNTIEE